MVNFKANSYQQQQQQKLMKKSTINVFVLVLILIFPATLLTQGQVKCALYSEACERLSRK